MSILWIVLLGGGFVGAVATSFMLLRTSNIENNK